MTHAETHFTVAGIDIGGDKKGCHLIILQGREILCSTNSKDALYLADLCNQYRAIAVGVDAPCRWATFSTGREAEKAMARERIFCFSTPTRERAAANASGFYGWMFNGERVFQALDTTHPLLNDVRYSGGRVCIETFPHAIACAMLGIGIASAKQKKRQRRQILEGQGIDTSSLKSIDAVDAALCAFTAQRLLRGQTRAYGDAAGGYIFVPVVS